MSFLVRVCALLLGLTCLSAPAQTPDPAELPPVDTVFQLSASATGRDAIQVRWRIAPGYYLYRHRTAVEALGGFDAGALHIPPGTKGHDEFFGDVETYRDQLQVTLPGTARADTVALRVKYQGCADVGVCYPPQTRTLSVRLPAASTAPAAPAAPADNGFAALGARLGSGNATAPLLPGQKAAPLPPEQAFRVEAIADGASTVLLRVTPARGYYVYRNTFKFALEDAPGVQLGSARLPAGRDHHDEYFGKVKVFFDETEIPLPLQRDASALAARPLRLSVHWQGCQDNGICYEPMRKTLTVPLPALAAPTAAAPAATPPVTPAAAAGEDDAPAPLQPPAQADNLPESSATATDDAPRSPAKPAATLPSTAASAADSGGQYRRLSLWSALLLAIAGGLILNLMPCVLPVLSLKALSLLQSGEGPQQARRHALGYTAGVLSAFALLGAVVLALRQHLLAAGMGWGFQLQTPWLVALLALIVLALGLSLSGLWYARVAVPQAGHALSQRRGLAGDFFTGVLAVVLATPCTAPFMGAALAYAFLAPAAASMAVFLGLGLGLALPFLLLGFLPRLGRFLPTPGAWMETLKQLLAFPLYATAAWLVWVLVQQRGADAFGLWAIAAICLALALWGWHRARLTGMRWPQLLALAALLGSAFALYSLHRLPKPAAVPAAGAAPVAGADQPLAYDAAALAQLRARGQAVLVNITADWCVTCKANERAVFTRDGFRQLLEETGTVYMVGDHTDIDPRISAFLKEHGAVGLPLYVFYPAGGATAQVLPTLLTPGIVEAALRPSPPPAP